MIKYDFYRLERIIAILARFDGLSGKILKVSIKDGPYIDIYLEDGRVIKFYKARLPKSIQKKSDTNQLYFFSS